MPYKTVYVLPEVVLFHKGVVVYRAYKDDDANRPLANWYALYPNGTGAYDAYIQFDLRSLRAHNNGRVEDILRTAIDCGEIGMDAVAPYVDAITREGIPKA